MPTPCEMHVRISALEERDKKLAEELDANTKLTKEVRDNTAEIIAIHKNAKMGITVIQFTLSALKWLGGIAIVPLSMWYYWKEVHK